MEYFDVLIVGAGLSGIGAAYHLQTNCPGKTFALLEGREALGGTWDLFRYPGVRSDSDMYTLGFSFNPWEQAKAIADGPSILAYLKETAQENGIEQKIRFKHQVKAASWSSKDARWTVSVERGEAKELVQTFRVATVRQIFHFARGSRTSSLSAVASATNFSFFGSHFNLRPSR